MFSPNKPLYLLVTLILCFSFPAQSEDDLFQDIVQERTNAQSGDGMQSLTIGEPSSADHQEDDIETGTLFNEQEEEQATAENKEAKTTEDDEKKKNAYSDKELWDKYQDLIKKGNTASATKAEETALTEQSPKEKSKTDEGRVADYKEQSEKQKSKEEKVEADAKAKRTAEDAVIMDIVKEYKGLNKSQGPMNSRSYGSID